MTQGANYGRIALWIKSMKGFVQNSNVLFNIERKQMTQQSNTTLYNSSRLPVIQPCSLDTRFSPKRCNKCNKIKAQSEFYKRSAAKDKLQAWCKLCFTTKSAEQTKKYRRTIKGYLRYCFDGMVSRCKDPDHANYKYYGGKGIKVRYTFGEFCFHIITTLNYDTYDKIKGLQIDRIDNDGHYERGNLRIVTPSQNQMNSRKQQTWCGRSCTSRYKGVCWSKQKDKWIAQIYINKKRYYLGSFSLNQERQAALAYDRANIQLHGEFGVTNQMLGLYN